MRLICLSGIYFTSLRYPKFRCASFFGNVCSTKVKYLNARSNYSVSCVQSQCSIFLMVITELHASKSPKHLRTKWHEFSIWRSYKCRSSCNIVFVSSLNDRTADCIITKLAMENVFIFLSACRPSMNMINIKFTSIVSLLQTFHPQSASITTFIVDLWPWVVPLSTIYRTCRK